VTRNRKPVAGLGIETVGLVVSISAPVRGPVGVEKVQKNLASAQFPCEALASAVPSPLRTLSVLLPSRPTMPARGARYVTGAEMNGKALGPFAFQTCRPY
jgi:hypothetical protein